MTEEEKLFRIYELMHERVINWDRLLTERTNMFILFSSILFAGFVALVRSDPVFPGALLQAAICLAGLLLSVQSWAVNYAGTRELHVYISICYQYELHEDVFDFLRKKQPDRGGFIGLDQWFEGKTVAGIPPITGWKQRAVRRFSSWNVYTWLIPALFFFLWFVALLSLLAMGAFAPKS